MIQKAYIIGLPKNEISKKYMEISKEQIYSKLGVYPELHIGTLPEEIDRSLEFTCRKTPTKKSNYSKKWSLSEKAIWFSHFSLWTKIREPSWIFEHDIMFGDDRPIPNKINADIATLSSMGNAAAYFLTPLGAKILLSSTHPISIQVDGYIAQFRNISKTIKIKTYQNTKYGKVANHDED